MESLGKCQNAAIMVTFVNVAAVMLMLLLNFHRLPHQAATDEQPPELPHRGLQQVATEERASELPVFAYYLTGTRGDVPSLVRLLLAVYHPHNEYVLHLERKANEVERAELAKAIAGHKLLSQAGNVYILPEEQSNLVIYRGVTMVTNYLHGAAVLMKRRADLDWYINLSAADYPLVRQDDLLHVFSQVPRDKNFIEHWSKLKPFNVRRLEDVVLDCGTYRIRGCPIMTTNVRRELPNSFKPFSGSAWVVLSRAFLEFLLSGWSNLPRSLLVHHANVISAPEFYFQTAICNSEFNATVVNSDLHYIRWNHSQHPEILKLKHFSNMSNAGVPFARKFHRNTPVLDEIDGRILNRPPGTVTPGGWCGGSQGTGEDPCLIVGDPTALKLGEGAQRLKHRMDKLLAPTFLQEYRCSIATWKEW